MTFLKVTIDNNPDNVRVREGEKNGRKWKMVNQTIWVHRPGDPYPTKMEITLPNDQNPYFPGDYSLDLNEYVSVGQFSALIIDTRNGIRLKPIAEQKTAPLFGDKTKVA